jgi:hypothetical protein
VAYFGQYRGFDNTREHSADIRRRRDTLIWKLEAALNCRSCKKGRSAPPVHMIKLTETREIGPYTWVHPDEDRRFGPQRPR